MPTTTRTSAPDRRRPRRSVRPAGALVLGIAAAVGVPALPAGAAPTPTPAPTTATQAAIARASWSLSSQGTWLDQSQRDRVALPVTFAARKPVRSVRFRTAGHDYGTVSAVSTDSTGRWLVTAPVDLSQEKGASAYLTASYVLTSGRTGTTGALIFLRRAAATPGPAPSPSPAPSTPRPTPTPTPTPTPSEPATTAPTPTAAPTPAPTPTPTPTTSPSPSPEPTSGQAEVPTSGTSVLTFGAVGDGVHDDTAALQRAFSSTPASGTVLVPAGRTFRYTKVLKVTTPGLRVTGGGTLLATDEERSSLQLDADDVVLDDVDVTLRVASRRWGTFDQMLLAVIDHDGVVVRDVHVSGSAAAGVYLWGAGDFLLDHVSVSDSRADGIHVTGPSHDGRVLSPVVTRSGDDGVAVVSYLADGRPVARVRVEHPVVRTTTWGRGLSVVGGTDITWSDIAVDRSSAAAVYIAAEGDPWFSFPPVRVAVRGGTITGANTSTAVDHGAVLVYDGRAGTLLDDVTVSGLAISGTRPGASRQVGLLLVNGARARDVDLADLAITGGPAHLFTVQAPGTAYETTGWTYQGRPVSDHRSG